MRSRNVVIWVLGVIGLAMLLGIVCQAKSCMKGCSQVKTTAGLVRGLTASLPRAGTETEPSIPSTVPPGKASPPPKSTRRPVFGTERSEGVEVEIRDQRPETRDQKEDTTRILVRKDGSVQNLGTETLAVSVTRVGPAWVQWDPSVSVVLMGAPGRAERALVPSWAGLHLDFGIAVKAIDIPLGRSGIEVGVPKLYWTTASWGAGLDLKADWLMDEHLSLDCAYFPGVREVQAGIGIGW